MQDYWDGTWTAVGTFNSRQQPSTYQVVCTASGTVADIMDFSRVPRVPVLGTRVLGWPFLLGPSYTTRQTGLSPTSQRRLHSNVIPTSTIDN